MRAGHGALLHLLVHLRFQPLLTLMVLTVRAVAMATGMRHRSLMRTFAVLDLHLGAGLCAAIFHRCDGSIVFWPSIPCTLNTFFAKSIPTVVIFITTPPLAIGNEPQLQSGTSDASRVGAVHFIRWAP